MIRIITWVVIVIMVMVIISEVPNLCVVNVSEVYLIDYCSTVLYIIIPSLQVTSYIYSNVVLHTVLLQRFSI